ncbi:DUF4145 domain-containing protein [Pseudomonas sp. S3_E10]
MKQGNSLPLPRCPHCNIAQPSLNYGTSITTADDRQKNVRNWYMYTCSVCGGVTMATADVFDRRDGSMSDVLEVWPVPQTVHDSIPQRARTFLQQAINSIAAPSGAVMLAASAVDAMLKDKGLKEGSLYTRIGKAATEHLITAEMAEWAHEVRLDANDQRHADEEAPMPDEADARKSIEFTLALAQFLFVLPARVAQGRARASQG